jgi:hypothetical protein
MGIGTTIFGVILFIIMNALNKRENDRIVSYVTAKAREMMEDPNSRQNFNAQYEMHQNQQADGPNGIK